MRHWWALLASPLEAPAADTKRKSLEKPEYFFPAGEIDFEQMRFGAGAV